MPATVVRISTTPIKGLALDHPESVELTRGGVPGDRAFFLVDRKGHLVGAKRIGALVSVRAEYDLGAQTLALHLPGGEVVAGDVEAGEPEDVAFFGLRMHAAPVAGPFSAALSRLAGQQVRLMRMPEARPGVDRGAVGAASLISRASLERLAGEAGVGDIDARRFRMTFELEGLDAHAEDGWVGHEVAVGAAVVRVEGHVGRCAVTTRHPETGRVDLPTLKVLARYRGELPATEPLPFGVHASVVTPGRVVLGDAVAAA